MFQFPGFAFMSYGFRHKYLLLISTNPRLAPRMSLRTIRVRNSELQRSKVGFPIRKSADQSLFAAPHGLSQRTTSFIASQRQGIHRIPLRHLIALIIDAHHFGASFHPKSLTTFRKDAIGSGLPGKSANFPEPLSAMSSIERPFASNISESAAVKPRPHWLLASFRRLGPNGDRIYFLFTMTDSAHFASRKMQTWFQGRP